MPNTQSSKVYVLDTNVLIQDPSAILNFQEHSVCLPFTVLEELDKLKQENSDRGQQARQATRVLDKIVEASGGEGSLKDGINLGDIELENISIDAKGTLFFEDLDVRDVKDKTSLDLSVMDNRIILTANQLSSKSQNSSVVVMVTNDTNMRVKADVLGLKAESYRNDDVLTDNKVMYSGMVCYEDGDFWEMFDQVVCLEGREGYWNVVSNITEEWDPGIFVLGYSLDQALRFKVLSVDRDKKNAIIQIQKSYFNNQNVFGLNARTEAQNFALNALMDTETDLVTLAGPAGSGKTLLALAASLELAFEKRISLPEGISYDKIIITREAVEMGEKIGFLPGNEEEKMSPWMQAFQDNLECLVSDGSSNDADGRADYLKSRIEMKSLGFMRGRSLRNTILIIDETQNTNKKQIKALLTRAGESTKIILLGNIAQIDSSYLNAGSTGLANAVVKFKDWRYASHVTLDKVERSRLAEAAEERL